MRTLTVGAIVADRSSDELRTVFVAFVGGLENDTLYAVSVKVADSQGRANRRSSTFRTLRPQTIADGSGIGDLAAGAGCAAQCIRTAQMEAGLRAAKIMSVRQGTFETAKRHVAVTFKRIRVSYDGDKGRNRGELSFFAKINGHWRLERGEGKVKSNSTVHFPNGGTVGYTDLTRWIDIKVQAVERDSKGTCYDSLGPGPFSQSLSGSNKKRCHKRTWNTAPGQFDLDEIFAQDALLPGFGGWSSFDKTMYADRGPIRFQVDLGFEVWSE